jgi:hypothetical protein
MLVVQSQSLLTSFHPQRERLFEVLLFVGRLNHPADQSAEELGQV